MFEPRSNDPLIAAEAILSDKNLTPEKIAALEALCQRENHSPSIMQLIANKVNNGLSSLLPWLLILEFEETFCKLLRYHVRLNTLFIYGNIKNCSLLNLAVRKKSYSAAKSIYQLNPNQADVEDSTGQTAKNLIPINDQSWVELFKPKESVPRRSPK